MPSNYPNSSTDSGRYCPSSPRPPPSYRSTSVYNQPNENEPLLGTCGALPPKSQANSVRNGALKYGVSIILTLFLIIGLETGYIYGTMDSVNIYDPGERTRIREGWQNEYAAYTQNITRLTTERDTMKSDWKIEHNRLLALREDIAQEHQKWDEERQQWEEERRKREEDERDRKHEEDEQERQRKLIQWGVLRKEEECVGYGTARYQAHLEYSPPGWDTYAVCQETPMHIHGRDVLPTECRHAASAPPFLFFCV